MAYRKTSRRRSGRSVARRSTGNGRSASRVPVRRTARRATAGSRTSRVVIQLVQAPAQAGVAVAGVPAPAPRVRKF